MKTEPIKIAQIMGKCVGGGVESVIMNYYRHIDRTKIQFDFICDEDSTNIPYEEIEKLGGNVILCPPYQKLFKYNKFLIDLFKNNKYSIVHSNINTLSVLPLRCAKKAGVPIRIAHSHSTITFDKKEFKRSILKFVLKRFSKVYANKLIACSDQAAISQFGKRAYFNNLVYILPNAIELKKFKFDFNTRKKIRDELKLEPTDFVVGHIGRFVTTKNHLFLLEIFSRILKEKKNLNCY